MFTVLVLDWVQRSLVRRFSGTLKIQIVLVTERIKQNAYVDNSNNIFCITFSMYVKLQ